MADYGRLLQYPYYNLTRNFCLVGYAVELIIACLMALYDPYLNSTGDSNVFCTTNCMSPFFRIKLNSMILTIRWCKVQSVNPSMLLSVQHVLKCWFFIGLSCCLFLLQMLDKTLF